MYRESIVSTTRRFAEVFQVEKLQKLDKLGKLC